MSTITVLLSQFASGLNITQFTNEVEASVNVPPLQLIRSDPSWNYVELVFGVILSALQITALNALIVAHVPNTNPITVWNMSGIVLDNVHEVETLTTKTDNLGSNTTSQVLLTSNVNLNGFNLIGYVSPSPIVHYAQSTGTFTTGSNTYIEMWQTLIPTISLGTYIINWYYEMNSAGGAANERTVCSVIRENGTTNTTLSLSSVIPRSTIVADVTDSISGFAIITGFTGNNNISFNMRNTSNNQTVGYISNIRVTVTRCVT